VLFKLAKFTHKLWYSPKARATFKHVCAKKEVKCPHSVRHDIMTRWNSSGDMLKDGDRTFLAIVATQQEPSLGIPRVHRLQKEDHKHLKNLNDLLKLLKVLTEILSRSGVPMLVDVIVHFDALDSLYTTMAADTTLPLYIRQAAERPCLVLNKYYQLTDLSWLYCIAIRPFVHPSMCAYYLKEADWLEEWIEGALKLAEEIWSHFYKPASSSSAQAAATGPSQFSDSSYMSHMYSSVGGPTTSQSVSPVRKFANGTPLVDHAEDGKPWLRNPLVWWHNQCVAGNEWNGLTQMALNVLSMPASTATTWALSIQAATSLGSYSKASLVKWGCVTLPQKAKPKAKAQPQLQERME
ncbi:hypothetical protein FS749_014426, partial [Ceratobasidium sp. UAMH 11750]